MKSMEYTQLPTEELLTRVRSVAETRDSDDSDERWNLVSALHRRPERAVFDNAAAWCSSSKATERILGADILGQLGAGVEPLRFVAESTPILVQLLHDGSDKVVASALIALGHLNAGEPDTVVRLQSHPSPKVRYAVAFALGGREDPASLHALVDLSGDDDLQVRDWATFALGTLCDADGPEIRAVLFNRLSDADREVRGEAMRGLARRGDSRAAVAILRELEAEEVLDLAVEAAQHLPSPDFLPHLERLLDKHPNDKDLQIAVQRCRVAS